MAQEILIKKHFNQYNPGEIASFEDPIAADIIVRGLGTAVKRDRKGLIVNEPVSDAATKPIGKAMSDAAPEPTAAPAVPAADAS